MAEHKKKEEEDRVKAEAEAAELKKKEAEVAECKKKEEDRVKAEAAECQEKEQDECITKEIEERRRQKEERKIYLEVKRKYSAKKKDETPKNVTFAYDCEVIEEKKCLIWIILML